MVSSFPTTSFQVTPCVVGLLWLGHPTSNPFFEVRDGFWYPGNSCIRKTRSEKRFQIKPCFYQWNTAITKYLCSMFQFSGNDIFSGGIKSEIMTQTKWLIQPRSLSSSIFEIGALWAWRCSFITHLDTVEYYKGGSDGWGLKGVRKLQLRSVGEASLFSKIRGEFGQG